MESRIVVLDRERCKGKSGEVALFERRWGAVAARRAGDGAVMRPDGTVARTFGGVDEAADRVAGLVSELPAGAVVSLCAGNVAAWPEMVLGIWRAGAVVLLVDATLGEGERGRVEQACGARARLSAEGEGWRLDRLAGKVGAGEVGGGDVVLIKLTSGTSGVPTAVGFTAGQVLADCDQVCQTMEIGEGDLNYGVIAFSHSYGFSNLVTPLLFRGVPVVAAVDALPRAVWEGVRATGATVLPAVPAILRAAGEVGERAGSLRLVISAGAPLSAATVRAFHVRHGLKIHSFYGASECGGICYDASETLEVPDGFVGTPLRGVRIVPLEEGDGGGEFPIRVRSRAATGMAGEFVPGDVLTGDAVRGFRLVGRMSDFVNVGGRKVNPVEVERVLAAHPSVSEAVVFGCVDRARAESLAAVFVAGDGLVDAGELRAWCAERLASWQVPREFIAVAEIPRNARGKVSRRELARRFG